jgi:hypothetical protein
VTSLSTVPISEYSIHMRTWINFYRMKDKTLPENLAFILETELPRPSHVLENDQQVECGICYAQYLPIGNAILSRSVYIFELVHLSLTCKCSCR